MREWVKSKPVHQLSIKYFAKCCFVMKIFSLVSDDVVVPDMDGLTAYSAEFKFLH